MPLVLGRLSVRFERNRAGVECVDSVFAALGNGIATPAARFANIVPVHGVSVTRLLGI